MSGDQNYFATRIQETVHRIPIHQNFHIHPPSIRIILPHTITILHKFALISVATSGALSPSRSTEDLGWSQFLAKCPSRQQRKYAVPLAVPLSPVVHASRLVIFCSVETAGVRSR